MRLRDDTVRLLDGSTSKFGVVERADFVIVIPIEDDRIWLVEQHRYVVGRRFWELPQGAWETAAAADMAEVARGELAEETGLRAGSLRELGWIYPSYGFATQRAHVFVATDLVQGAPNPSPEEGDLIARRFPVAEFEDMLRAGEIRDGLTLAAWTLHRLSA